MRESICGHGHISFRDEPPIISKEVGERIRKAHGKYNTTEIHIFAAIPLGLAYLIGSELNACGRIHLHEFDNSTREYFSSGLLKEGNRRIGRVS
jgi:hypothetical protein